MAFSPECTATGIGSFPQKDASSACELILNSVPEIPLWPQLSAIDFREQMEIQFSEGFPRVVLDEFKQRMYFDTSGDPTPELEKFYENYVSENLDDFKISADFSRGIQEMEKRLSRGNFPSIKFFKSQVTGPVTFGLAIVDEKKRAIYYNDVFRDVLVKGISMKARWLLKNFKPFGYNQMCFIDEPILSAFGSSTYVSVQRGELINCLKEVVEAVHKDGALAGMHCCGNTEWPILVEAGVDIISFDAYQFGETIAYYPEHMKKFLEGGGALAWGIVPTSEKIKLETPDSLAKKLKEKIENLAGKGIDKNLIWERCLLTPSCGTGSLSVELSEKIFLYLRETSRLLHGQ
jgi:methionine synthase II (cobalamin-independent)